MIYNAQKRDIGMALTGDTMLASRLSPFDEPEFLAIADLLHSHDVAFTNLETTVRLPDEGAPDASAGTLMTTQPGLLDELKWLGINLVSCANNHAMDFGQDGVLAMSRHLEQAGLAHSGIGATLDHARRPAFLDTANGRVALVSANAFFEPHHRAASQWGTLRGRPGINPLGYRSIYTVGEAAYAQLVTLSRELGLEQEAKRRSRHFFAQAEIGGGSAQDHLILFGNKFVKGGECGVTTQADPRDLAANLRWVREARRQADWVVVSLHCHACSFRDARSAPTSADRVELADFARHFCKAVIDAGADVVACHGPHISLGIEIYQGKPIFYSLGNFVFQNDNVTDVPRESFERFGLGPEATPTDFLDARTDAQTKGFPAHPQFWRSLMATCRFSAGALTEVELHPLDLGYQLPRSQRGRPVLATGEVSAAILHRTAELSSFYGTQLEIGAGKARVKL
jgi:poly-gamma-glutamate synthesis protein (capsule biosynthesis protein)